MVAVVVVRKVMRIEGEFSSIFVLSHLYLTCMCTTAYYNVMNLCTFLSPSLTFLTNTILRKL